MKEVYLIITLLLVCSCRQGTTPQNQELLLGEWYPIEDTNYTDLGLRDYNMQGYRFMEDGFCDYYPGYFEYADPDSGYILAYPYRNLRYRGLEYWLRNIIRAYGNQTLYEIRGDTLQMFNLSSKVWDQQLIRFLAPDTLLLSSLDNTLHEKYIRKNYIVEDKPLFDQLIFYSSYANFSKSHFFSIQQDGTYAYGDCSYRRNDFFTGKLKAGTFEQLETLLKKADITRVIAETDSLYQHSSYIDYRHPSLSSMPPNFDPYVTFISDNQFFTMQNPLKYVSFENKTFFWAFFYGLFLPEVARFEPGTFKEQSDYIPFFECFVNITLQKPDSIVDLYHTEKFYLGVLLNQADTTDADFEPIYTLKEFYSSKKSMQTDGRYFSYINEDGKKITLDIGFNFIRKNGLDSLFRRKNDIEISFETGKSLVPPR